MTKLFGNARTMTLKSGQQVVVLYDVQPGLRKGRRIRVRAETGIDKTATFNVVPCKFTYSHFDRADIALCVIKD